ncbi:MAG: PfkB family carbohydrate kinase, partial [Alphaproteobacteria bacterium]
MILVFGALNMDMVMRVPEMPRPSNTVVCPGYSFIPGGKGANQAAAAALSGAGVRMFGCVGKDDFAKQLKHSLGDAGVNTDGLHVISDAPTGCAAICVDQVGENMIVVAAGANDLIKSSIISDGDISSENLVMTQCEVPSEETWDLLRRAKA